MARLEPSPHIVTVNGGSSSIKLAVYAAGDPPRRVLKAEVERIGTAKAGLTASSNDGSPQTSRPIRARNYEDVADEVAEWIQQSFGSGTFLGVGHRIVHGGLRLTEHQIVTAEITEELRRSQCFDPTHLPRELRLLTAFGQRFAETPHVACFDTEFHREMPVVAKLLPIPRQYLDAGVRRLGFHGLSYTYLMQELKRLDSETALNGRVILAHLGSGASMAAVRNGKPVDTTMAFTPAAGLMMGTRPGDIDPGVLLYLRRIEQLDPEAMDELINRRCGLSGVSGGTSDVRELVARRRTDQRAKEALDLFCYQAKKWMGAYTAVLAGLDTLVFSGGIGEHSPEVRAQICDGLEALGVELDPKSNAESAPVISSLQSAVTVRVIPTDEQAVIAKIVYDLVVKTNNL